MATNWTNIRSMEIAVMPLTQDIAKLLASKDGTRIRLHYVVKKSHKEKRGKTTVLILDEIRALSVEAKLGEE